MDKGSSSKRRRQGDGGSLDQSKRARGNDSSSNGQRSDVIRRLSQIEQQILRSQPRLQDLQRFQKQQIDRINQMLQNLQKTRDQQLIIQELQIIQYTQIDQEVIQEQQTSQYLQNIQNQRINHEEKIDRINQMLQNLQETRDQQLITQVQ
jgi:hypothetical protein